MRLTEQMLQAADRERKAHGMSYQAYTMPESELRRILEAALAAETDSQPELENKRLRHGLQIIIDAARHHGWAWCVAQARGALEDLDFDQYPETGKPPA